MPFGRGRRGRFVIQRSYPRFGFIPIVWAVEAVIIDAFPGNYTVTSYAVCTRAS